MRALRPPPCSLSTSSRLHRPPKTCIPYLPLPPPRNPSPPCIHTLHLHRSSPPGRSRSPRAMALRRPARERGMHGARARPSNGRSHFLPSPNVCYSLTPLPPPCAGVLLLFPLPTPAAPVALAYHTCPPHPPILIPSITVVNSSLLQIVSLLRFLGSAAQCST